MGCCESQEVSGVGSSSVTIAANDSGLNYYPTQLGIPGGRAHVPFPLMPSLTLAEWLNIISLVEGTVCVGGQCLVMSHATPRHATPRRAAPRHATPSPHHTTTITPHGTTPPTQALVVGILVATVLGFPLATESGWRIMFGVTPVLCMLLVSE